jgi:hypothetical protein
MAMTDSGTWYVFGVLAGYPAPIVFASPKIDSMAPGQAKRYRLDSFIGGARHLFAIAKTRPQLTALVGGAEITHPSFYQSIMTVLLRAQQYSLEVSSTVVLDSGSEVSVRAAGCFALFTLMEPR